MTLGSTFIGTLPSFWLALLILFFFGYIMGWFPTAGGYDASTPGWNGEFIVDAIYHSVLPASVLPASSTLAMLGWSIIARACRSASKLAMT